MNLVQIVDLLNKNLSIQSFYDHAPVGTVLPFIAIHSEQPDNFAADNYVYCEKTNIRLDLYTVNKDLSIESSIKALLNENGIFWTLSEQYLDDQACYEIEFEFDVLGDEDIQDGQA